MDSIAVNNELLSSDNINLVLQILTFLLGGGVLISIWNYIFNKPRIVLLNKIEKDEKEYLFAIKFKLKNIGKKVVNLSNCSIKLYNVLPQEYKIYENVLLSYKFLQNKRGKKKYYVARKRLPIRAKNTESEFSIYKEADKNANLDILITGITTDTIGQYYCALKLFFVQKFLYLYLYRTKWLLFEYEGEVPPGIILLGNNALIINKIYNQIVDYVNNPDSLLIGSICLRHRILNCNNIDEARQITKTLGADIFIWISDEENLEVFQDKIKINFQSEIITNNLKLEFKSINIINKVIYIDRVDIKHSTFLLQDDFFNDIRFFLHDVIYSLALSLKKIGTVVDQINKMMEKIIEIHPMVMFMLRKGYHQYEYGMLKESIITYEKAIRHIEEIIEMPPESRTSYYKTATNKKLIQTQLTLFNNIGSSYYKLPDFKKAFKYYCLSLKNGYWFQPYDTITAIWSDYTGIAPKITEDETMIIVNSILKGTKLSDVRNWFIDKRKRENCITKIKEPKEIFEKNEILFEVKSHNVQNESLKIVYDYKPKPPTNAKNNAG